MKKQIIAIVIAGAVLLSSGGVFAANALKTWVNPANKNDIISQVNYPIYVNGVKVDMKDPDTGKDQTVMGYNGRTYVPVRKIAEMLGADSAKMWQNGTVQIITPEHSKPTDFIQANLLPNGALIQYVLQTNSNITNTAKAVVAGKTTKEQKAYALYQWVINHMQYDYAQAEGLDNGTWDLSNQGAIYAYNTGKGICYDYACLYAEMADAVGLNVRLTVGYGKTDTAGGGHAWNEVQGTDGNWFSVDATWGEKSDTLGWNFHETDTTTENPDKDNDGILDTGHYPTQLVAELENY